MDLGRKSAFVLAALLALALPAEACGPEALGVARIAQVGSQGGLEVGWKTYAETLPLADHEVILTFDDGPDPKTTPLVLDALKAECVQATFFAIGRNVEYFPAIARREVEEGHNVAYHTFSHPQPTLRYMAPQAARADILKGMIAIERAAYHADFSQGEPDDLAKLKPHAPFFRFPGFDDTADLRGWFASHNIAIFGVDLWASDWIEMTPEQELKLVLARLEKARKGMLLLHDNKPWTTAMMPKLLRELKARGYKIVHIVPGPGHGPTESAPAGWRSETARAVGAVKPRLDAAAAKSGAAFIVKPAPQE